MCLLPSARYSPPYVWSTVSRFGFHRTRQTLTYCTGSSTGPPRCLEALAITKIRLFGVTQVGWDLRRSLIQPPAKRRVSHELKIKLHKAFSSQVLKSRTDGRDSVTPLLPCLGISRKNFSTWHFSLQLVPVATRPPVMHHSEEPGSVFSMISPQVLAVTVPQSHLCWRVDKRRSLSLSSQCTPSSAWPSGWPSLKSPLNSDEQRATTSSLSLCPCSCSFPFPGARLRI